MKEFRKTTVPSFKARKAKGEKIAVLTAYDYTMGKILDRSGVDAILVGDSVATAVQGRNNTLSVTLDQMVYHTEMVGRAVEHALLIADMPFPSHLLEPNETLLNASRFIKEAYCDSVKIEGGQNCAQTIKHLVNAGIPVMGHIGLQPQAIHQLGGHKVQRDEKKLLADAKAVENSGAFSLVLECIPEPIAQKITDSITIPTIGIGAGAGCDGQVLVSYDILGLTPHKMARFVKKYANLEETIEGAAKTFCQEVREGIYPAKEHTYPS
ncbi:MAG: 3-methyl-2-oxobutanoate hydroxymethyltransferase [Pirellulaceae bacterium]|nr:3-methyl-2-oxobutanoate hydroxymethyltransferase [Pirellulaceae bacterium]